MCEFVGHYIKLSIYNRPTFFPAFTETDPVLKILFCCLDQLNKSLKELVLSPFHNKYSDALLLLVIVIHWLSFNKAKIYREPIKIILFVHIYKKF